MFCLNQKAGKFLRVEVEKCAKQDYVVGEAQAKIVLSRLDKLQNTVGKRATEDDLAKLVRDIFPDFSEKTIRKAAKMNRSAIPLGLLPLGIIILGAGAGLVWFANLPYPMIRRPVSRVAPIVLFPSYLNMDRNYREAIANVEQADQLVNKATSRADIELGKEKVTLAQKNLDQLPVWFLGYEPKLYCSLMSCSWKFTFDEFEGARKQVGRMEAVVFQEINALDQLENSEVTIQESKQNYQIATTPLEQQAAVSNWQSAIDKVVELPPNTLAGRIGRTKLVAYQRDFQQVSGILTGGERTTTRIEAAKEFAKNASQICQNAPHAVAQWEQCEELWRQSIDYLKAVPLQDTGYLEAQKLLASYTTNLGNIQVRKRTEIESLRNFEEAQRKIEQLLADSGSNPSYTISQLQGIINQLNKVQSGTTVYPEAQSLLKSAQNKLTEVQGKN
jgi:hypothetical protein